jgi:hypothetical protein
MPQFNDPTVELTYLEKDDVLMSGSPVDFANIKAQNVFNRSLTRSALQTLISASELIIGQKYTITNAVTSTLVLVVEAVAVNKLDEIAVNASNGDNVSYDITTDIATAIQQTQINGTGFVKASGTTLSYDNSTYLTTIEGIAAGGELEGNYASPTLKNSSVVGKVLTGLSVSGSAVLSTDSILTGIGKLQNQVNGLAGGVEYQGTWNASTNTPTLTSSVGTQGFYYVVSVAGSTNLNGITSWELGDWAIFNGSTWQKVDNTDAVVSVNGYTGIVTLSAADVSAVPYTGATTNVDLGTHSLTASDLVINHASGSGVAASITKGGAGEALTVVKSSGSGNAASITGGTTLISTLSVTGAVTLGTALAISSGGTGLTATPTNGQIDIGNGTGFTRATITGTANQVTVTNASGSITLSLPQSIATSSTPTFAGLTLNGTSTVLTINSSSAYTGYRLDNSTATVTYRNWAIASNAFSGGDLNLIVSASQGGNPFSGGTYAATIKSNGNFLIGSTTDGGEKLQVTGTARITGAVTLGSSMTMVGDLTTIQNGSTYYRVTANNSNAIAGLVMTTGTGASLQAWLVSSNVSGASGEFSIRDSTAGVSALTITKATRAATFSSSVTIGNKTTTEINALTPATGMVVFNTTLATLCFYDGTGWKKVTHSAM